jgi:hypothetical protein
MSMRHKPTLAQIAAEARLAVHYSYKHYYQCVGRGTEWEEKLQQHKQRVKDEERKPQPS